MGGRESWMEVEVNLLGRLTVALNGERTCGAAPLFRPTFTCKGVRKAHSHFAQSQKLQPKIERIDEMINVYIYRPTHSKEYPKVTSSIEIAKSDSPSKTIEPKRKSAKRQLRGFCQGSNPSKTISRRSLTLIVFFPSSTPE